MGDETNQMPSKRKLFRVFRISRLLPNLNGEKYKFKRISANSWLSPIGGDSNVKRCSSGSYKPIDSKTDQRLEQCQRRAQTAAEIYRKRKRENQIDTSDILAGIQLKANGISEHDAFKYKNGSKEECQENRPNDRVTRKIKIDITLDTSARPKTCLSYTDGYSDPALGLRDLLITSTLNKPKCSKELVASVTRPHSYSTERKANNNKVHWTETFVTDERTRSAPPCIRPFHERKVSNFGRPNSKSPQYLKSRSNTYSCFDSKLSTLDESDKDIPNRRAVLRSLLQKKSPAMKHWAGCPFDCKDCFKACLVSEDFYRKMKVNKSNQKQSK